MSPPNEPTRLIPDSLALTEDSIRQFNDFDPRCIAEMDASLDRSGTQEILDALVADAPAQRQGIEQAIAGNDRRNLQRHVHTIKGTLRLLKAPVLAEGFGACELALSHGGELTEQAAVVPLLLARYEHVLRCAHAALDAPPEQHP